MIQSPAFNSRFPLESFDPRYRSIWLKAAVEEVKFEFPSEKEAQAFQARIHMYRSKVRKSGDEIANTMYRAKSSRKGNILYLRPADAKFSNILDQFNQPPGPRLEPPTPVGVPQLDEPVMPVATAEPVLSVDDIFSEFDIPDDDGEFHGGGGDERS